MHLPAIGYRMRSCSCHSGWKTGPEWSHKNWVKSRIWWKYCQLASEHVPDTLCTIAFTVLTLDKTVVFRGRLCWYRWYASNSVSQVLVNPGLSQSTELPTFSKCQNGRLALERYGVGCCIWSNVLILRDWSSQNRPAWYSCYLVILISVIWM